MQLQKGLNSLFGIKSLLVFMFLKATDKWDDTKMLISFYFTEKSRKKVLKTVAFYLMAENEGLLYYGIQNYPILFCF